LSLLLLRELYVAVTRAQQRVVVLTKGKSPAIAEFFRSLNCSIEEVQPASILVEFQKETTANDWFSKGAELYEEEKYDLAAGCYKAASQFGWKGRASGRFDLARGQKEDAGASFRNAARIFFESLEYKNCLDTMTDLATIQPWKHTWTESDNELLDDALKREPNHLPRSATVIFALIRGSWDVLQSTDLMDVAAESTFTPFRTETKLKDLVRACSDAERKKIEDTLPNVIGDYYHDRKSAPDATRLYFRGRDFASAVAALEKALASNVGDDSILTIVQYWLDDSHARQYLSSIKGGTPAYLLVSLFEDPKVAFSQPVGKNKYIRVLGKDVVRFAVTDMSAGSETAEILHRIDNRIYRDDILALLVTKKQPSEVVTWFLEHENKEHAVDFAVSRLGDWADTELLSFIPNLLNHSHKSLVDELERLSLLESAVAICLNPNTWDLQMAEVVSNRALSEVPERRPTEEQGTIVFVFTAMWRARQTDDRVMSWMKNGISSPIKFFLAANQSRIEEESDSSSDDDGSVPALLGKIAAGNSSEESSDDDMPGLEDRHRDDDNNSSEDDLPGLVAPQHDNAANSSDDSSDDGSAPPRMEARNRAGSYDGSSSSSSYNYDHKDDDDSSDSDGNGPPVMVPHRPK
jgi:tetratricopeptide (TPR) repeat protein